MPKGTRDGIVKKRQPVNIHGHAAEFEYLVGQAVKVWRVVPVA